MPGFVSRKPGVQLTSTTPLPSPQQPAAVKKEKGTCHVDNPSLSPNLILRAWITCSRKPLVPRLSGKDEGSIIPTTPNCCVLLYFTLSPFWIDLLHVRSMFNFNPQLFNFFVSFELKIIILIYFENNIISNATRWKKICKCIFIFDWISNEICQVQYFFWTLDRLANIILKNYNIQRFMLCLIKLSFLPCWDFVVFARLF